MKKMLDRTECPESGDSFNFLIDEKRHLLRTKEVSTYLARSSQYVVDLIEEGKLEAHATPGREKKRYVITRRSVLLYLAESAAYDPRNFSRRLEKLVGFLNADELKAHTEAAARLLGRK